MSSVSSAASSASSASSASANSLASGPAGSGSGSAAILGNAGTGLSRSARVEEEEVQRQLERRRATTIAMDRKRRLTSGAEEGSRRPSMSFGGSDPGPSNGTDIHNRPLPPPPSWTGDEDGGPGSSRATAINISSSPEVPSSQHNPTSWPRTRRENDYMEYILPRWQPDTEAHQCPICGTQFSFWYRKHHCRKCGRVVCSSCSPHRITIPRQFIVRPTDLNRRPASMFIPPSTAFSPIVDLTVDGAHQSTPSSEDQQAPNPALGGGEEVRLCNPCVPDPNPDPPLGFGYGAVRSGLERLSNATWVSGPSVHQPLHRAHHSLSSAPDRDARRQRRYGMISQSEGSATEPGSQYGGSGDLPSYGSFGYTVPSPHGQPPRYQFPPYPDHQNHSPPAYSSPRSFAGPASLFSGSFGSRPYAPHHRDPYQDEITGSSSAGMRPRHPSRSHHPRIDERDLCPICNRLLPPRGPDGNEDAREAHVRDCIEGHGRSGRSSPHGGSPSSQPPHPMRMLAFTATEKDCVGHDGVPQECTICMEEYEVGEQLARLECLCKFHKTCIVEWFGRKKECPVHKVS